MQLIFNTVNKTKKRIVLVSLIIVIISVLLTGNLLPIFEMAMAAVIATTLYFLAQAIGLLIHKPVNINTNAVILTGLFAVSVKFYLPLIINGYDFYSDAGGEVGIYQAILSDGWGWNGAEGEGVSAWLGHDSLLHAAFVTTRLPALIQPLSGLPPMQWYTLWIGILLSLAPGAVFLLAKRFTKSNLLSLAVLGTWMVQWYFVNGFDYARVVIGIAISFVLISIMARASISKKGYALMAMLSGLLVVTYYGATIITVILLASSLPLLLLFDRKSVLRVGMVVLFLVIAIMTYNQYQPQPLVVYKQLINQTVTEEIIPSQKGEAPEDIKMLFFNDRDPVLGSAFGLYLKGRTLDYKINWVLNWFIIIGITVITVVGFLYKRTLVTTLGMVHLVFMIVCIIIPVWSSVGAIARFWFTCSPVMMASGLWVLKGAKMCDGTILVKYPTLLINQS